MRRVLLRKTLGIFPSTLVLVSVTTNACSSGHEPADYTCISCTIATDSVLTLTGSTPDAEPTVGSVVRHSRNGRYIVAGLINPALIAVYDSAGRFTRTVGTAGDGPGEFRQIDDIAFGPSDSLYVLHDGRLSVFDSQFQVGRSIPLEGSRARYLFVRPDGSFITAMNSDAPGPKVVLRAPDGRVLDKLQDRLGPSYDFVASIAVRGDTVWIARTAPGLDRSVIGRNDGASIFHVPGWWAVGIAAHDKDKMQRAPQVNDLQAADSGRIWIAAYQYGKMPVPKRTGASGEAPAQRLGVDEWGVYTKSVIEIVDGKSGEAIAGRIANGVVGGFVDASHLFGLRVDSAGNPYITIYTMALTQPPR